MTGCDFHFSKFTREYYDNGAESEGNKDLEAHEKALEINESLLAAGALVMERRV